MVTGKCNCDWREELVRRKNLWALLVNAERE